METVVEFLDKLASKGVKLSAQEGRLNCYAQRGALTNDLKDGIIKFKPELIALLERVQMRPAPVHERAAQSTTEFPLSSGQIGLYLLQKLHPGMSAYNVPLCFRINADIDVRVLAAAWDHVQEEFPILTARIFERDGALLQRFDDRCRTILQRHAVDFTSDGQLLVFLQGEVKRPFDLNRGPLTRIELFEQAGRKPILLLTVHHIVIDGASAVIVLKSLIERYQQLSEGRKPRPSRPQSDYRDFVAWEEAMLASGEGAAHARYWQQRLDGPLPTTELPPDSPRPATESFAGKTFVADLPADLCRWVHAFSKAHSMPSSVIFLAVFQILLHRYTDQDDIVVGMPVMGRPSQQFAAGVGYFINLVPLRAHCGERLELLAFLRKVQGTMLDALYHSSYPFPLIVEGLRSRRQDNGPLFRISYAYQNFVRPADFLSLLQQQTFQLESVAGVWQEGDFELGLEIYEGEESSFNVHLKYNPELYAPETIARLVEHYAALLQAMREDSTRFVHEYSILPERERHALRADLDQHRVDHAANSAQALFLEQVTRCPESPAVVCGEERLTYRQLEEKSRNLALYLQSLGVGPDHLVGLCVSRSVEMVVGLLGILRAGGAYVPLDPADPDERLESMLRDGGVELVLTEGRLHDRLRAWMPGGTRLLALDGQGAEIAERAFALKAQNVALKEEVGPNHLAYVIYRFGSAGEPHGVEVSHRSLVNLLSSIRKKTLLTERDTLLSVSAPSLDVAILEWCLPLSVGAQLAINARAATDAVVLLNMLEDCGATAFQAPPSTWRGLLAAGWTGNPKLTMVCTGEELPRELADRLLGTGGALWHLYGAAEAGIVSAIALVEPGHGPVPLGIPIDNTRLFILDRHGLSQPRGVAGELYIAGDGLARGYRNRPERTATKFMADPFVAGARMVGTGDRARRQADGSIQSLGRSDRQVRIQGCRIELGEIEAHLNRHPKVQDCVVLAQGNQRLTGIYRAKDTTAERIVALQDEDLRGHLRRSLPESMIPASFVSVALIPLTANGNVDRRALEEIFLKRQLAYWREKLADVPDRVELLTDEPRLEEQPFAEATHAFGLDAELTERLKELAHQRGGTLFAVLLAAFKVLLHRYTGQHDLCVGSRVGEPRIGTNGNLIALRSQVEPEDTFSSFLSRVKTIWTDACRNQDAPFERVMDTLRAQRNPLQVVVSLGDLDVAASGGADRGELEIRFADTVQGVAGLLEYNAALYRPSSIQRMTEHFVALCRSIVAKPSSRIRELDCLSEPEKERVLITFNDTRVEFPAKQSMRQMFAEQVELHPDQPAVICGDVTLSYQELSRRSGDLALDLQSLGVVRGGATALAVERSLEMIIGIMAIVQAGGAYVPLDPTEPEPKLAAMLQESAASIVLTQEAFKYRLASLSVQGAKLIALDRQWPEIQQRVDALKAKDVALRQDGRPDDLAYILFSSTASGKPAGVQVEQRALMNRIRWMQSRDPLSTADVVLQRAPSGSDLSLWEILWPIMTGATVVFAGSGRQSERATTLWFTPSTLRVFLNEADVEGRSIRRIFCYGEGLDKEVIDRCRTKFPHASLNVIYGPAEAAGAATAYDCSRSEDSFMIGSLAANVQAYVLDPYNRPQPIGVAGELFVAGEGLAREYLKRPALTKEMFVANPFAPGTRMFKTGDLARWREDGHLQYLGKRRRPAG